MQGEEKLHEAAPIGTVRLLRKDEDYGFLEAPDGREVYFHRNSVLNGGFDRLTPGTRVAFAEEAGEEGPQASTVRRAGKHRLR
jgi:cold shock CspA family protein